MSHPSYISVALSAAHDVAAFDCGTPSLNSWLSGQALRAQAAGTARTFVWVTENDPVTVRAYFSLAPTEVTRDALSSSLASGYNTIPAYLLARLALRNDLHGFGYGGQLLVDALSRVALATESAGGRLLVVDALDESAARFYKHYDFTPIKGDPHRLVLKIASIRNFLGLPV